MSKNLDYKSAGVDIEAGNRIVERIRPLTKMTSRPEVIGDIGRFSGLFSLAGNKYKDPVLVSATDGVGTKLKLAFMTGRHDTVGIDLVAMVVNDIVVEGAEPLFFLDYFATGKLDEEITVQVITGIANGCKIAGCALIGGETAEMPSMYNEGEYDLAGFGVGVVEKSALLDGSDVRVGHQLIGISSSGVHSNGFSLIRKLLLEEKGYSLDQTIDELGITLGEELLRPTQIYVKPVLNLLRDFKIGALSHITGGGLKENIERVLPKGVQAVINTGNWQRQPIFDILQREGRITDVEMRRTFNNGIGMVLLVDKDDADEILNRLEGQSLSATIIGEIIKAKKAEKDAVVFS